MPFLPSLRPGSSLLDVFKAFPKTSKPLIEFHEILLRGSSPFTEAERELIAAYVSGLNHCRYCHAVRQLVEGGETNFIPEKMRPVLRYAQKLTDRPDSVTRDDADAILAAGGNETALYHTVAVTALFNFMNRLVEGLGIELDHIFAQQQIVRSPLVFDRVGGA